MTMMVRMMTMTVGVMTMMVRMMTVTVGVMTMMVGVMTMMVRVMTMTVGVMAIMRFTDDKQVSTGIPWFVGYRRDLGRHCGDNFVC